ncbi:hypothetical protein [Burkholderia cepacia]|uniref:hypothetical protein n=1 Tax=Burkholderia cepacia TaxID=292 RepID=UPI002FE346D0
MKNDILLKFAIVVAAMSHALCWGQDIDFANHPSALYRGSLHIPRYYKKTDSGWRDDDGKLVGPPVINFAGKYHIGVHSCGMECRYYTLSDLSTGKDLNSLDMFSSSGKAPNKTQDGRSYITELLSKADSKMLVAKYYIDASSGKPAECRERKFILDDNIKIVAIPNSFSSCKTEN